MVSNKSNWLLKLVDEKHYNDFIEKGEIFFGDVKRYQDIEREELNKGIGDKNDSHVSFSKQDLLDINISLAVKYGDKDITLLNDDIAELDGESLGYTPNASIFCSIKILLSDLLEKKKFKSDINQSNLFDDNYRKKVVLITDKNELLRRIEKSAYEKGDLDYNDVTYKKDLQNYLRPKLIKSFADNKLLSKFNKEVVFSKDLYFSNQRETRFAIFRKNVKNKVIFNVVDDNMVDVSTNQNYEDIKIYVGNISDITVTFDSIDSFLERVKLVIPK
ncbi:hypothetical protein [Lactobacillus sp. Sy-1]|uniref:hypothetical protein n=1 Tax=Lactobacillus sp. Sy-1 TaxID=2109645 RepID=UPI001C5ACBF9|nr:hypothetical protein [Lactobacillus sp. Sy-1]MBW1606094.1 hypothetical protein [Lactobacillus sp. Sy-1]